MVIHLSVSILCHFIIGHTVLMSMCQTKRNGNPSDPGVFPREKATVKITSELCPTPADMKHTRAEQTTERKHKNTERKHRDCCPSAELKWSPNWPCEIYTQTSYLWYQSVAGAAVGRHPAQQQADTHTHTL